MPTGQLTRSTSDRRIGGVAGGLAGYLGLDPTLIRVLWVIAAFMGFGIFAYILLWVLVPESPSVTPAVRIAEERYARGEIDADELARIRRDLEAAR